MRSTLTSSDVIHIDITSIDVQRDHIHNKITIRNMIARAVLPTALPTMIVRAVLVQPSHTLQLLYLAMADALLNLAAEP